MADSNVHPFKKLKRQIELRREELAAYTAEFLERGGQIVELPVIVKEPEPAKPSKRTSFKTSSGGGEIVVRS